MDSWNAVIDVSNVCWSPYLPPVGRSAPVWDRLELVMAAWRAQHGAGARFELVADESLQRVLGPDTRHFAALRSSGQIRTAAVADDEILRLAVEGGLHVITRDHYIDHRAEHRWIDRASDRFHGWDVVDGTIRFAPLGIKTRSAQDVSMAREVKALRHSAKLDPKVPAHRKILLTRWRCPNTSCRQAAQWQAQLLAWPRVAPDGTAACPSCRGPLTALGPRDTLHEVVVAELGSLTEITRFPLEAGCPVIVGRGAAVKGIDLAMYATGERAVSEAIETVSRMHLVMRLTDAGSANWRLSVLDLNSTNGTMVQRWEGSDFGTPRPVPADTDTNIGTRDRLILGDAVLLRLSGKRFLAEPATPLAGLPRAAGLSRDTAVVQRRD